MVRFFYKKILSQPYGRNRINSLLLNILRRILDSELVLPASPGLGQSEERRRITKVLDGGNFLAILIADFKNFALMLHFALGVGV